MKRMLLVLALPPFAFTLGGCMRDNPGFTDPAIPSGVLGLLCALLVPVQVALIVVAMQGFRQRWNVEVERSHREPEPAPAPA